MAEAWEATSITRAIAGRNGGLSRTMQEAVMPSTPFSIRPMTCAGWSPVGMLS
ncbi:hypothetical protein RAA17_18085 [Komagataeibacter rhaeticus]|nr:hypothetical protein [Komagataeibacter rhaeticus]